jgi:ubiquinone biosynthesis protein Coq4
MRNPLYLVRFSFSFLRLVGNLEHLDNVLELNADLVRMGQKKELKDVIEEMKKEPLALQAFAERHRFPRLDGKAFRDLPQGSLGKSYSDFLLNNHISPSSFPDKAVTSDVDYMTMHLYETHDLWHVLTGYGTDLESELELQAFYVAQTPGFLPVFILVASLLNAIFVAKNKIRPRIEGIIRGYQRGKQSKNLVGVNWLPYLKSPLDDVRAQFAIAPTQNIVLSSQPAFA